MQDTDSAQGPADVPPSHNGPPTGSRASLPVWSGFSWEKFPSLTATDVAHGMTATFLVLTLALAGRSAWIPDTGPWPIPESAGYREAASASLIGEAGVDPDLLFPDTPILSAPPAPLAPPAPVPRPFDPGTLVPASSDTTDAPGGTHAVPDVTGVTGPIDATLTATLPTTTNSATNSSSSRGDGQPSTEPYLVVGSFRNRVNAERRHQQLRRFFDRRAADSAPGSQAVPHLHQEPGSALYQVRAGPVGWNCRLCRAFTDAHGGECHVQRTRPGDGEAYHTCR